MTNKGKIILFSSIGVAVLGTSFYLLFWRKRNAVTDDDVKLLSEYQAIDEATAASLSPAELAIPAKSMVTDSIKQFIPWYKDTSATTIK